MVFCPWMMSGLGLKVQVPPSPTKAILPHSLVARMASCLPASLAEASMARSTPLPPVTARISSRVSSPGLNT